MGASARTRLWSIILIYIVAAVIVHVGASVQLGETDGNEWDHLIFTQQWPQSYCSLLSSRQKNVDMGPTAKKPYRRCKVPEQVRTWTVHGIWPTLGNTKHYPECCNSTYKFNCNEVQPIMGQLDMFWPNLNAREKHCEFWKHEWEAHGTCALNFPPLRGEYKYFHRGLLLNQQYNLGTLLRAHDIVPSDSRTYKVSDVRNAIFRGLKVNPDMQCINAGRSTQYLVQVQICLNKSFAVTHCPHRGQNGTMDRSRRPCDSPELMQLKSNHSDSSTAARRMERCVDSKKVLYPPIENNSYLGV